jgi:diguanylate cyclase (GGDEF)-like protein
MRILVAEDDVTSRHILTVMLTKWGFSPLVTEDGDAAWAALQQADAPKLVLLDRNMPGIDGLEICRRLRLTESSNPAYVILLTGQGEKQDIVGGLEAGANDYVTKPYHNAELQARIRVGQRMLELQTHLVEARDALAFQATHDALTGVLNRRAIMDRAKAELVRQQRDGRILSVGMCDIDHFKRINDTYGHQIGDEVLIGFARRLQEQLRAYDYVGRYGGEEFLVLTPLSCGGDDTDLYERLCARIARVPFTTTAGEIPLTVSIGVVASQVLCTVDGLIADADAALYHAKASGRNRVLCARP